MKKIVVAALLGAASLGVMASDYFVVVPVKNRAQAVHAEAIAVSLSSYTLPVAAAGQVYAGVDFTTLLSVTGDSAFTGAGVAWELASGALPSGLTLNPQSGVLSGTPGQLGTANFEVKATYKTKTAQRAYELQVAGTGMAVQAGGYRAWADGSLASSCYAYRYPSDGIHTYSGDVGTGTYRIQPGAEPAMNVVCDMSSDDGGWTLVARITTTSTIHLDRNAVGALTAPAQPTTAKLSDTAINTIAREAIRVVSDANPTVVTNYHRWDGNNLFNSTSPTATGNRDTKATWGSAWTTPAQNQTPYFYYGFKAYRGTAWLPNPGINYGYGSATGAASRNGMEVTGRGWNQAGQVWVR